MSSTAINCSGFAVHVGDAVSIRAKVVSVSGIGSLASVTCQAPLDASTFVVQADDASAVQHQPTVDNAPDSTTPAVSLNGKNYGRFYEDLTVLGSVTSISGTGVNAILTVKLKTSQTSINTAAGNVYSDQSSSPTLP
jgi:hypothetical protein